MRSGCAGHARIMFARRASARAWARRACAGGARRASARARATSQRARRTSIRKAGMPHTLLAALFTSRLCENSNLVRIFQKKNCFSLKKTTVDRDTGSHKVRQSDSLSDRDSGWPDSGSESLGRLPPPGPGQRPSRPRRCCGTGYRKSQSHKEESHGCTETHLEVFNALEIVCPGGKLYKWCTSTSICYGACIVCFKHAFDSP